MKESNKREDIAARRFQLIAPLLATDLDAARTAQLKKQLCKQSGLSERTLRRYLAGYRRQGFAGLKPYDRTQKKDSLASALLEEAILLRREAPHRSVRQIDGSHVSGHLDAA